MTSNFSFKMFLSLVVVLSFSCLSFTKPLSQEMPSLLDEAFNPQSRDQASQPQADAFQTEENMNQESGVQNGVNGFLNMPVAHNRTARDVLHPCFSHMERKWDSCRQAYVTEIICSTQNVACHSALAHGYPVPACKTVIGYPQAKFISKCAAVKMGCQCAA